jgi:hypothetical protein
MNALHRRLMAADAERQAERETEPEETEPEELPHTCAVCCHVEHNRHGWRPRPLASHPPVSYGHVRLGDRRFTSRVSMLAALATGEAP